MPLQPMKNALILAVLAVASATTYAGALPPPTNPVPDAGASILLLGMGMSALGLVRWAKKQ
jgi:hypothetical protein